MPEQTGFPLDRQEKFKLLNETIPRLPAWVHQKRGLAQKLKALITQIEYCTFADGCRPTIGLLAGRMGYRSERSISEAVQIAEELKLLEVVRNPHRVGGQGPNEYRIRWDTMRNLYRTDAQPAGTQCGAPRIKGRAPLIEHGAPRIQCGAINKDLIHHPHPPSKSNPHAMRGGAQSPVLVRVQRQDGNGDGVRRFGRKTGWPEKISREDLMTPAGVEELFGIAVAEGWIPQTDLHRVRFFALARYCRQKGREPGAYFTFALKNGKWELIRGEDEDAARRAIRELDAELVG